MDKLNPSSSNNSQDYPADIPPLNVLAAATRIIEKYGVLSSDVSKEERQTKLTILEKAPESVQTFFKHYDAVIFDGASREIDVMVLELIEHKDTYVRIGTYPSGEPIMVKFGTDDHKIYLEDDEFTLGDEGIGVLANSFEEYLIQAERDNLESEIVAEEYLNKTKRKHSNE